MALSETNLECELRVSLAPFAEEAGEGMTDQPWICGFAGWRFGWTPTPDLLAALQNAHPFPESVGGVWAEHLSWQNLREDRAIAISGYEHPPHVAARVAGLEFLMDALPDATVDGLRARFAWLDRLSKLDTYRTNAEDARLARRMGDDFEEFAKTVQNGQVRCAQAPSAPARRTQAERRRDVMSILSSEPELSDREIARRVGVSPQTVSTWRRKASQCG